MPPIPQTLRRDTSPQENPEIVVRRTEQLFLTLVEKQFATLDFDAEHPVYLYLVQKYGLTFREACWLSFLYMAFYDEASAWVTFLASDPFDVPEKVDLPIGTNRRNLFGGKIRDHFTSLKEVASVARDWPTHNFVGDPVKDWEILKRNIGEVWGNGRFAIYTTAEMVQKVCGAEVTITGFDNDGSSAPADGLCRIYGCERKDLTNLDRKAEEVFRLVQGSGFTIPYAPVDRGVVESVLCNYSACCRGRFYSGRNVDRQQGRILRVEAMGHDLSDLWEARKAVLRQYDLGELNGWTGIDKKRLTHFRDTGVFLWTYEGRQS